MAETAYYFNPDADACEICQSAAGYYLDSPPERSHENCDCIIEEYDVHDLDNCISELRNIGISEGYETNTDLNFDYTNCQDGDETVEIDVNSEGADDVPSELYDAAIESGWAPIEDRTEMTLTITEPAWTEGSFTIGVEFYTAEIDAERWQVCELEDGQVIEQAIESLFGTYTALSGASLTASDVNPCANDNGGDDDGGNGGGGNDDDLVG